MTSTLASHDKPQAGFLKLLGIASLASVLILTASAADIPNSKPLSSSSGPASIAAGSFPSCGKSIPGNGVSVRLDAGTIQSSTDGFVWDDRPLAIRTFLRGLSFGNGVFVAVGGSYVDESAIILTSRDGANWVRRNARTKSNLYCVTFGRNLFVAVGDGGAICTSADGITWARRTSGKPETLLATVAWGCGRWVVGGESGTILTSTDGVRWSASTVGEACYIGNITCREGEFVAQNLRDTFVTTDGTTWRPGKAGKDYLTSASPNPARP